MSKIMVCGFALLLFVPSAAVAAPDYSASQCAAWFSAIDRNHDGTLSSREGADSFLARVTLASEEQDSSGGYTMARPFFMTECGNGSLGKPKI
jgi:hypothetical protein